LLSFYAAVKICFILLADSKHGHCGFQQDLILNTSPNSAFSCTGRFQFVGEGKITEIRSSIC